MDDPFDLTNDDDLVDALRQAVPDADDPVPRSVHDFALAVFDLGQLDVELAALIHDSLVDQPAVAARAEPDETRVIVFSADDTSIELQVMPDRRLRGHVAPPDPEEVQVQTAADATSVAVDEFGEFEAPAPDALMRVLVRRGSRLVATPWMRL